jgi:hypothetical protein
MGHCFVDYFLISLPTEGYYVGIDTTVEMPLQGAFFPVRRGAYPRCELGRSPITLKMEATCSSETSALTKATRRNIAKGISHC